MGGKFTSDGRTHEEVTTSKNGHRVYMSGDDEHTIDLDKYEDRVVYDLVYSEMGSYVDTKSGREVTGTSTTTETNTKEKNLRAAR